MQTPLTACHQVPQHLLTRNCNELEPLTKIFMPETVREFHKIVIKGPAAA